MAATVSGVVCVVVACVIVVVGVIMASASGVHVAMGSFIISE